MKPLTVLSWNILSQDWIDFQNLSEYYPNISSSDMYLTKRLKLIIKYIRKVNADIIFLQEVTIPVQSILKSAFSKKYLILDLTPHLQSTTPVAERTLPFGNATLLKRRKFTNIKHWSFYFHPFGTAYDCTQFMYNNLLIKSVNTHYDSEDHDMRISENKALLERVGHISTLIIAGDFNTDCKILHNAYDKLHFVSAVSKSNPTGTYLCEKKMIDYQYYKGFYVLSTFVDNTPLFGKDCNQTTLRQFGSDHYPILCRVQLKTISYRLKKIDKISEFHGKKYQEKERKDRYS